MKFSSILALAGTLAACTFAAPATENMLEKRLGPADEPAATARMFTLYTDIKQYTGVISMLSPVFPYQNVS